MKKSLLLVLTLLLGLGTLTACEDDVNVETEGTQQATPEVSTPDDTTPTDLYDNIVSMTNLEFLVSMNDIRVNLWAQDTLEEFKSELNLVIADFEENYALLTYSDFYNFYCEDCTDEDCTDEDCTDEVAAITDSTEDEVDEADVAATYAMKIVTVLQSVVDILKVEENQTHLFNFIDSEDGSLEELNGYLVIARMLAPTKDILIVAERDALWAEIKTNTGCACNLFNTSSRTLTGYESASLNLTAVTDFITTLYCEDCEGTSELTEEAQTLMYYKSVVETYLGNIDQTKF